MTTVESPFLIPMVKFGVSHEIEYSTFIRVFRKTDIPRNETERSVKDTTNLLAKWLNSYFNSTENRGSRGRPEYVHAASSHGKGFRRIDACHAETILE